MFVGFEYEGCAKNGLGRLNGFYFIWRAEDIFQGVFFLCLNLLNEYSI